MPPKHDLCPQVVTNTEAIRRIDIVLDKMLTRLDRTYYIVVASAGLGMVNAGAAVFFPEQVQQIMSYLLAFWG